MNGQLSANNITYTQGNLRLNLLHNQGNQALQEQVKESATLKLIPVQPATVFVPGTGFVNAYLEKRQPEVALNQFIKQEPDLTSPTLRSVPAINMMKEYNAPFSITKYDCRSSTIHFSKPPPMGFGCDFYAHTLAALNGEKTHFCEENMEEENEEEETIEETKRIDEKENKT